MTKVSTDKSNEKKRVRTLVNQIIDETIKTAIHAPQPDLFYKSKAQEIMQSGEDSFELVTKRLNSANFQEKEAVVKLLCHFSNIKSISFFKNYLKNELFLPRAGNLILQHFNRSDVMIDADTTGNLIEYDTLYQKLKQAALDNRSMQAETFPDALIDSLLEQKEPAVKGILYQLVEETGQNAAPVLLKTALKNKDIGLKTLNFISTCLPDETLKIIQWISSHTDNKTLIKEIKRIMHRFKLKGIDVGFEIKTSPDDTVLKRTSLPEPQAICSKIDIEAIKAVIFTKPLNPSEVKTFYFILGYEQGLIDLNALTLSQTELSKYLKKINAENHFYEVPMDYAVFMIEKSLQTFNGKPMQPPASLSQWQACFSDFIGKRSIHPVREDGFVDGFSEEPLSEQSITEIIRNYGLYSWFFTGEGAETAFNKLKDILGSSLVLSDDIKSRRIEEMMDEATNIFFTPKKIDAYRSMFEDIAYMTRMKERKELSKTALAAAIALDASDCEPAKIPLCKMLIKTAFDVITETVEKQVKEKEENRDSGLLHP